MASCHEVYPIQEHVRSFSKDMETPMTEGGASIEFAETDEIEKAFDPILKPYNLNLYEWFWRINANLRRGELDIPWAMIALDREYKLAGHFCSIRGDKTIMPFSYYSSHYGERSDYPPISFIFVLRKDDLEITGNKSVFLKSAWEMLKDKSEKNIGCVFRTRFLKNG